MYVQCMACTKMIHDEIATLKVFSFASVFNFYYFILYNSAYSFLHTLFVFLDTHTHTH